MPGKPVRGFPAKPGQVKRLIALPERVYDQIAVAEGNFAGSNIGNKITRGQFRYIRYRNTPEGPEEDPTGEISAPADIPDLYAKAADPDWPEAKAFLDAADALARRLFEEQGPF